MGTQCTAQQQPAAVMRWCSWTSCHGLGQERPGCPKRCFQRFLWRLSSHPSPKEQPSSGTQAKHGASRRLSLSTASMHLLPQSRQRKLPGSQCSFVPHFCVCGSHFFTWLPPFLLSFSQQVHIDPAARKLLSY